MNSELTPLQRAAIVIKELRRELDDERRARQGAHRDPGDGMPLSGSATTPEKYWELLARRGDAIREVPRDRWNVDDYYDPELAPGTMNTRWGGFIDDVDQFDPAFFDLGQREASSMDPQQRLLLETAWEALEDAALAPDHTAGSKTGAFVGMCSLDYGSLHGIPPPRGNTGVSLSIAVNRLSYWFDWTGPSFVVDTACSASLLSVHLASDSLRRGECRMAVAGGVNLILSPTTTVSFSQAGMMAPDGRCKTFDESADGYVRGEGCGLVVLKRLSHALEDGDRILALILGSATNQDGRTNGLTAPKGTAQIAVIREALRLANVSPHQVSYVEAHGTGTTLGDAVEVAALAEALGDGRGPERPCVLSAAKSNIGHLESAAGIAGLTKVVLALRNEAIPPVAHFRSLNPKISFRGVPFSIPTEVTPWPAPRGSRYAGLSSFSFGGSNVHLVLGEAPDIPDTVDPVGPPYVLPLAAKSDWSLERLACRTAEFLSRHIETRAADVCHTAAQGRCHFSHRLAVVGNSTGELAQLLRSAADGISVYRGVASNPPAKVAPDFENVPQQPHDTEPRLTQIIENANRDLRELASCSVTELLAGSTVEAEALAQFAVQYVQEPRRVLAQALAALWVRGHSIDWNAWLSPHHPRKIGLPTYPFQRRRCWLEPHEIRPHIGAQRG